MSGVDDLATIQQAVETRVAEEAEQLGDNRPGVTGVSKKFVRSCLKANEVGDGMLFIELMRGQFIWNTSAGEWLYWAGHYWQRDTKDRAGSAVENVAMEYVSAADGLDDLIKKAQTDENNDLAKKLTTLQGDYYNRAKKLRSVNGIAACLKTARMGSLGLSVDGEQLDQNPWLLACENGVVDLRNGLLRDGKPDDHLTMACPTEYLGLDVDTSPIEAVYLDVLNNRQDVVDYKRKVLGYAITGHSKIHDFFAWNGIGRNGKSMIIEAIADTLGPLAQPIPAEMLLEQPGARGAAAASPDIMSLRGLRIAYASETDEGRKFSSSRVKWLTGGDKLTGRWPHDKYPVTFTPTHTLFLLTNHKPRAGADDFAFWERCRLLHFELSYIKDRKPDPEKNERRADPDLPERLKQMRSLHLSWLVNGCLEWQRDGHLAPPPFVRAATAEYRREEDLLQEWLDDRCSTENPDAETKASQLYSDFEQWYRGTVGNKPPSAKWFGKQLQRRHEKIKRSSGYFYIGLRIEDGYDA
ncbi:putative DNA primase/helicase [Malonomonas rubra DSM 5091]|uniref:Putative DNA primase/helicase n=1 Tax=Malonomonas rubra DSM 5091 TaxID=1122189 RepID=A0A1M6HNX8_MALRU|nr:phage/plasmid primase, P4 family [Malonomonas rubra]SHJ23951.1 putative DNA primase/helicase [Malonomonas rubra DSM 5091]